MTERDFPLKDQSEKIKPVLSPVQGEMVSVGLNAVGMIRPEEVPTEGGGVDFNITDSDSEQVDEELEQQEINERRRLDAAIEELQRSETIMNGSFSELYDKATQLARGFSDYPVGAVLSVLSDMTDKIQRAVAFARSAVQQGESVRTLLVNRDETGQSVAVINQLDERLSVVNPVANEFQMRIAEIESFVRQGIPIEQQVYGLADRATRAKADYSDTLSSRITPQ